LALEKLNSTPKREVINNDTITLTLAEKISTKSLSTPQRSTSPIKITPQKSISSSSPRGTTTTSTISTTSNIKSTIDIIDITGSSSQKISPIKHVTYDSRIKSKTPSNKSIPSSKRKFSALRNSKNVQNDYDGESDKEYSDNDSSSSEGDSDFEVDPIAAAQVPGFKKHFKKRRREEQFEEWKDRIVKENKKENAENAKKVFKQATLNFFVVQKKDK